MNDEPKGLLVVIEEAIEKGEQLDVKALVLAYPEMSVAEATRLLCHNCIIAYANDAKELPLALHNMAAWEVIRAIADIQGPALLVSFDEMLSPFYNIFDLPPEIALWWKEEALRKLQTTKGAPPVVKDYWQKIANGDFPYGFKEQA